MISPFFVNDESIENVISQMDVSSQITPFFFSVALAAHLNFRMLFPPFFFGVCFCLVVQ